MRLIAVVLLAAGGCHDWSALSSAYGEEAGSTACVAFVVAGDTHTCARRTDGSLLCWGDNRFGQLGTGDTTPHPTPTPIGALGGTIAKVYLPSGEGEISADRAVFTCGLTTASSLLCWGDNRFGQLGTGDTASHATPSPVTALGAMVARAAAGGGHTCAQTSDGTLWCWGQNQHGQLGTGDTQPQLSPAHLDRTPLGTGVDSIAAGGTHTCAHKTDGTLWCWGNNQAGELGTGDSGGFVSAPAQVDTLGTRVTRATAGGFHTCATTSGGGLSCWGDNRYGQLGTGDATARKTPVEVASLGPSVNLAYAGGTHTCALKVDGSLWCWGDNRFGQLGTGDTSPSSTPVQAAPAILGTGVVAAYAGGAHTCAVKSDGSVWCWGNNQYGQLGVGASPMSPTPVQAIARCP